MKTVIGYCRVSTTRQGELSFEAQERKIRAYCETYDLDLLTVVKETASGKNIKGRVLFQGCLERLKQGHAEGLIVSKLDRLTRNCGDSEFLIQKYFKKKYYLFSVQDHIDTTTAMGRFTYGLKILLAQLEREQGGERTSDAMQSKKLKGEYTGGRVPYGQNLIAGKLQWNPGEQTNLAFVKTRQTQGDSLKSISENLNRQGIVTRHGGPWTRENLRSILKTQETVI